MPMPRLMGKINKRVFNPREIRKGKRPVLIHTGRKSGQTFFTPLDAHEVEDGYLFIAVYGQQSDWIRNILASGTAKLRVGGDEVELSSPEVINTEAAVELLAKDTKMPAGFLQVDDYLRMKVAA